jgi:hypothetical protein
VLHFSEDAAGDREKQVRWYRYRYCTVTVNTIRDSTNSVEDPGCFIPDPTIFSSRIQNFFLSQIPDPTRKVECKVTFFLASYAFRSKVLVVVKKIRDPEKIDPGARI